MSQSNREQLRAIMREHNLSPEAIRKMLCVEVQSVRNWLYDDTKANYRGMKDSSLKLLKLLIKEGE